MTNHTPSNTGFIIQLERAPANAGPLLEASGLALIAARTVEGLYVEPARSLGSILALLEERGAEVISLRSAGIRSVWQDQSMEGRRSRLRNPLSACWLPTHVTAA